MGVERVCPICLSYMAYQTSQYYPFAPYTHYKCICGYTVEANPMIVLKEINPKNYPTTPEIDENINTLLDRMNQVRKLWAKPMFVTSGLRSKEDQERINPKAPKSKHLIGAAIDISDPDGSLNKWCKDNEQTLVDIGLWMEERQGRWQHFQILPPGSGNRWFNP